MREEEEHHGSPEFEGSTGQLINRVRAECRKFHRSAVMNDELRALALQHNCELKLVLDVRSRWNSTARMLRNFLALEKARRQFYGEKEDQEPDIGLFPFTAKEMRTLKKLAATLCLAEQCVQRLSRADATLMSADMALQVSLLSVSVAGKEFVTKYTSRSRVFLGPRARSLPLNFSILFLMFFVAFASFVLCLFRFFLKLSNFFVVFQALLCKLQEQNNRLARTLYRNTCVRVLERRGLASRVSKFIEHRTEHSKLDGMLQAERIKAGDLAICRDEGSIVIEIAKFQGAERIAAKSAMEVGGETEEERAPEIEEDPAWDDYDKYVQREQRATVSSSDQPTPEKLEDLHKQGYNVLPRGMVETAHMVQPTSVPAERLFSKARAARRYNQEAMSDQRFGDYRFLAGYYVASEPWSAKKKMSGAR